VRILALLVLLAMIAGAVWLWQPSLLDSLWQRGEHQAEVPQTVGAAGPAPGPPPRRGAQPPVSRVEPSEVAPANRPAQVAREPSEVAPANRPAQVAREASEVAPADRPAQVAREARRFVDTLTRVEPASIPARRADHFVAGDQVLRLLPADSARLISPQQLVASGELAPDAPITVIRSVEQVDRISPARLIADSAGDARATVRQVLEDGSERSISVGELVQSLANRPTETVRVVRNVDYFVQTTPAELLREAGDERSTPVRVVAGRHGLEAARIRDLIPARDLTAETVFYVRTVRETDDQGIWGIVHDGIIDNFARGIAIRRGEQVATYRVNIPRDADELRADRRSSFLGRMIHGKSLQSYVYNLRENRMGRNPDRIRAGQEIIIINFEPDELIGIYQHFVNERG
jgi:hypothetical protein